MENREKIVEYERPAEKQHSTAGVVGAALGGTGLGVALLNVLSSSASNLVRNYLGGNGGGTTVIAPGAAPAALASLPNASGMDVLAPVLTGVMANAFSHRHHNRDEFVTEKELRLVREIASSNAEKDSEIARLKAEKYADNKVQEAVDKLQTRYDAALASANNKICNLETHAAVTATSFEDYKQFANRVFVHQPVAKMTDCIVTTQAGCCCPCQTGAPAQ